MTLPYTDRPSYLVLCERGGERGRICAQGLLSDFWLAWTACLSPENQLEGEQRWLTARCHVCWIEWEDVLKGASPFVGHRKALHMGVGWGGHFFTDVNCFWGLL